MRKDNVNFIYERLFGDALLMVTMSNDTMVGLFGPPQSKQISS